MNKTIPAYRLILYLLIPYATGLLFQFSLAIPYAGLIVFYILPLCMIGYWFWVGTRFAYSGWSTPVNLLVGNSLSIFSLLLYFFQLMLVNDKGLMQILSDLSQCYTISISMMTGTLAAAFEPNAETAGTITITMMQVLSVLFTSLLFFGGYSYASRKRKPTALGQNPLRK